MSSALLGAVLVLASALTFSAAQTSCKDRCGAEYYRGYTCQCDYNCLTYGECCQDYESKCTTKNSCKGRCGEAFKRGRLCNCDADCVKYNQCCSDYKSHCDAEEPTLNDDIDAPFSEGTSADDPLASPTSDPSEEEMFSTEPTPDSTSSFGSTAEPTTEFNKGITTEKTSVDDINSTVYATITDVSTSPSSTNPGATTVTGDDAVPETTMTNPTEAPSSDPEDTSAPFSTASYSSEPSAPAETTQAPTSAAPTAGDTTPSPDSTTPTPEENINENLQNASSGPVPSTSVDPNELNAGTTSAPMSTATVEPKSTDVTTVDPVKVPSPTSKPKPSEATSLPQKPDTDEPLATKPTVVKPTTKPGSKPVNPHDPKDYQADDSNDTNLCSGRPVGAVTTLMNGTMVVFRGHYFWLLDSNRVPGPAQGITQVWGVPSPVDTVFTRCNCEGKTYIFKGRQYWRFENNVLDPGYPKVIQVGFDGLRGHITAALSVPQHRQRREAVYFFKRGGTVQRYSYQAGTRPSCGKKVSYTMHSRVARQAVSVLEAPIRIKTSWRGFPTTITAAVSVPNKRAQDGYKYYVFSRSKSYNVRMDGDHPVVPANTNRSPQSEDFFKCPKKV